MSFYDFDAEHIDGYEPFDGPGGARDYEMLVHAANVAGQVKAELAGEITGALKGYFEALQRDAAQALDALSEVNPQDMAEIMRQQQIVYAFRHLNDWVQSTIDRGDTARDMMRGQQQQAREIEEDMEGETDHADTERD